jgi:hypothetical protein
VQLAGCTIAVLGMLYAFYVKPVLRRRRREQSAVRSAAAPAAAPGSRHPGLTPVASVSESST